MAHLLFWALHLCALVFGALGLIVTIPLHLIYIALSRPQPSHTSPSGVPQVHCPECRELVRFDARKCKHCGAELTPAEQPAAKVPPPPADSEKVRGYLFMSAAVMLCIVLALSTCRR